MKTVKFIVVAIFIAILGFGLYTILHEIRNQTPPDPEPVIPEGCDLEWAKQYIDSSYSVIPDNHFDMLKLRREQMQGYFGDIMSDAPKQCKEYVDLRLRNGYQTRFIEMAHNEFKGEKWTNFSKIKKMNDDLYKELSQGSEDLKKIKEICSEFSKVLIYNQKVNQQCKQRPSLLVDQWNFVNTRNLIDDTPIASAPVNHTDQYKQSRPKEVKRMLYDGHVAFLDSMLLLSKRNIAKDGTEENYSRVFDIVSKEIEQFKTNAGSLYGIRNSLVEDKVRKHSDQLKSYEKRK